MYPRTIHGRGKKVANFVTAFSTERKGTKAKKPKTLEGSAIP
jgi:hypothetical protein